MFERICGRRGACYRLPALQCFDGRSVFARQYGEIDAWKNALFGRRYPKRQVPVSRKQIYRRHRRLLSGGMFGVPEFYHLGTPPICGMYMNDRNAGRRDFTAEETVHLIYIPAQQGVRCGRHISLT